MKKMLNFDKFLSETQKETFKVQIFGEEYEVKNSIPASIPVMMARLEADTEIDDTVFSKYIMNAADTMLGKEVVDKLCQKGMSSAELVLLVQQLFKTINGTEDDETQELDDESGKVVAEKSGKK